MKKKFNMAAIRKTKLARYIYESRRLYTFLGKFVLSTDAISQKSQKCSFNIKNKQKLPQFN